MTAETIPAGSLKVRPGGQDRTSFDQAQLEDLAASIGTDGCLYPPIVRPVADGFEIVAGERRVRAMRDVLGWDEIPADVRDLDDEGAARVMLVENIVRCDLDPIAEARAYADRIDRFDLTPAAIARECGIPAARVRNRLRLLSLSEHVAHFVATKQLPLGHAQEMAGLDANRQAYALQAYQDGPLGLEVFSRVCGRLANEQAEEDATGMFDAADFLRVEEWVREETELVRAPAPTVEIVREQCFGLEQAGKLLGLGTADVRARLRAEAFPAPDLHVDGRPAWWESTIDVWCADVGHARPVDLFAETG